MDDPSSRVLISPRTDPKKLAMLSMLSAAAIASNYLLIGVANVKFMDLIVFTAGYVMGPRMGASTGVMIWLIYGTLNPYGFNFPILIATMLGEAMFGLVGGFYGRGKSPSGWGIDPWAVVIAFITTSIYDLFTNVVSAYIIGLPIIVGLATGIPFMIVHVVSNSLFFGIGFKPLSSSIRKVLGE